VTKAAGRRHVSITRLILAVAGAACLGSGVRADAASLPSDRALCPRISRAASLPLWPGGVRLRGDLNGDGYPDRISVRYAPKSRASCGFLLVAKTRAGVPAMRLPEWYKPPQDRAIRNWPFAEPYLVAVVRLEAHRSQVVVARSHGASVANVSIHGIVGGRLVQLRFHPRFYRDELGLFGTIGTGDTNVRCRRGGPLVLLSKGPTSVSGRRWFVSRSAYRLSGGQLRRTRTRTVRSTMGRVYALAHRWGMDALPFTGCTVARGRRL
jgi:hypothetical protein